MNNEGKLIIRNENNEEKEFYILVTFDIEEKNKSFVIYTDYSESEEGNIRVYASIYNKNNENDKLIPVTEKDEIDLINEYLIGLEKDIKSGIEFVNY